MLEEQIEFHLETGLNADVATRFVQIASRYTAKIQLIYEDKKVNGKSIMSLLTLAVAPGDLLTVRTRGEDEKEALKALLQFLRTGKGSPYPINNL